MRIGQCHILLALLVVGTLAALADADPDVAPIRVALKRSRQTTWFTGPVNPDGTVNYYQALYGRLAARATPENNAAVPLIRALGTDVLYPWVSGVPSSPWQSRERARALKQTALRLMADIGIERLDASPDKLFVEFQDWQVPPRFADHVELSDDPDDRETTLQRALAGPWRPQQNLAVSLWLEEMAEPMGRLRAAARLPVFYLPSMPTEDPPCLVSTVVPSLSKIRSLCEALLARAQMRAGQGMWNEARADVIAVAMLGKRMRQDPNDIIQIVAISISRSACDAAARMSLSDKATGQSLEALAGQLAQIGPVEGCLEAADLYQRVLWLDTILKIARGIELNPQRFPEMPKAVSMRLWKEGLVDWSGILADANRLHEARLALLRQPEDEARGKRIQAYSELYEKAVPTDRQVRAAAEQFGQDGAFESFRRMMNLHMRNRLLSILLPSMSGLRTFQQQGVIRHRQAILALHLGAYRSRTGRYPDSLPALPADVRKWAEEPFHSGRKMQYRRTEDGFGLTSVGGSGRLGSEGVWHKPEPVVLELPPGECDD